MNLFLIKAFYALKNDATIMKIYLDENHMSSIDAQTKEALSEESTHNHQNIETADYQIKFLRREYGKQLYTFILIADKIMPEEPLDELFDDITHEIIYKLHEITNQEDQQTYQQSIATLNHKVFELMIIFNDGSNHIVEERARRLHSLDKPLLALAFLSLLAAITFWLL